MFSMKKISPHILHKHIITAFILCLWISKSYFLWNDYPSSAPQWLFRILFFPSLLFLLLFAAKRLKKRNRYFKNAWTVIIVMVVLVLCISFLTQDNSNLALSRHIRDVIITLILFYMTSDEKEHAFRVIFISFIVLVMPSIIYFVLRLAGVNLPYSVLMGDNEAKILRNHYYQRYFCGLLIYQNRPLRPCGVFDEAGTVGTIAAILYAAGDGRIEKKWRIIILAEGILSFSMAFYFLIVIYMLAKGIIGKSQKTIIIFGAIILLFILFVSVDFNNENIAFLQGRIIRDNGLNIINNRETPGFDAQFDGFIRSGGMPLWFGNGEAAYTLNPVMSESCSFRCLIYDFGIVGSFIYVLVFVLVARMYGFNKETIPLLLVFFFSMYQRPYVFDGVYIAVFILSLEYINRHKRDKKHIEKKSAIARCCY